MQVEFIHEADDRTIARWIAGRVNAALDNSSAGIAIAMPGGTTPISILAKLGDERIDWKRVAVFPTDERHVPDSHPASNAGRICAALGPLGARVYQLDESDNPPHFTLTWLGMGLDGHIASLFPNTDPRVDDPERVRFLTPDPLPPEAPYKRLSLTIPALLDSDELLFVIRGAEKRALFEAALRGENDLPVTRLLRAADQPVTCFT